MDSEFDQFSLSDKSFEDESEEIVSSDESDYDPESGADLKNVHQVITEERRKQLVSLINDQGYTIAKASRKVGLMYSTAKTIYAKYKKESKNLVKGEYDEPKIQSGKPKATKVQKASKKGKVVESRKKGSSKGLTKVEESERLEAPCTRKRVKTASDKLKENFVCKIKELHSDASKGLAMSPAETYKVEEAANKKETKIEDMLSINRSKQSTDHSIADSIGSSEGRSQMEAMMLEALTKQKLLSQLALSKAFLSGPLLGMSQLPYNQAILPSQALDSMMVMNYLWRQSCFPSNVKQMPQN